MFYWFNFQNFSLGLTVDSSENSVAKDLGHQNHFLLLFLEFAKF